MRHDVMRGVFEASSPADDSVEAAEVPTPRKGPSTPIGAYLSERLISVVRKIPLVFPIPSPRDRAHLTRNFFMFVGE